MSSTAPHEDGQQRNAKDGEESSGAERFHEAPANAHQALDSKDERSIANKLAHATEHDKDDDAHLSKEDKLYKEDATAPARSHGNEPSRGAVIDQEIRDEEEEYLKKKEEAKAQSEAAKKK